MHELERIPVDRSVRNDRCAPLIVAEASILNFEVAHVVPSVFVSIDDGCFLLNGEVHQCNPG